MQRIVEFKRTSFWSGHIDIDKLNEKMAAFNKDGWRVVTILSNTNFLGIVRSYTLLLELEVKE